MLSPAPAEGDFVADLSFGDGVEVALADAQAAVVADLPDDLHDPFLHGAGVHGAGGDHRALGAALAQGTVVLGHPLADDANIVEFRLGAVVGAAADGDLEFVGKDDLPVALVKTPVDFGGQLLGIDVAVDADGALTGDHGADLGTGAAVINPSGRCVLERRRCFQKGAGTFDSHRGEGYRRRYFSAASLNSSVGGR